jgi:uncharacterized membrane protein
MSTCSGIEKGAKYKEYIMQCLAYCWWTNMWLISMNTYLTVGFVTMHPFIFINIGVINYLK